MDNFTNTMDARAEVSADALHSCPSVLPISVIVPAYNAEAFLAEAINSVRNQRCAPQEIIVIDDGSIDRTREIARELDVQLHMQQNRGVSASRNTGVLLASSPWVAFLDADDVWEPDKLALQWLALQRTPASLMSFTGSSYFNEIGPLPGGLDAIADFRRVKLIPVGEPDLFLCEPLSYARSLANANFIVHSSILISREVFIASSGYDETMRYSEDLDWLLRVATLTPVALVKQSLTRIRTHTTNSSRNWDRMILSHIAVGLKVAEYAELYPLGVAAEFERQRPQAYFEAGLCLFRSLDIASATKQFLASWKCRRTFRAAFFLGLTSLAKYPLVMHCLKLLRSIAKWHDEQGKR